MSDMNEPGDKAEMPETEVAPAGGQGVVAPETGQPAPPAPVAPPAPPAAPRPKIDVLFLILGIATPFALGGLGYAFPDGTGTSIALTSFVLQGLFFVFLGLWIWGKTKSINWLRSYGVGGMWAYAAVPLLLLVLFGTCLMGGLPA